MGWLVDAFVTVAGALEALCAMAHAHLELGVASPFLVSSYLETLLLSVELIMWDPSISVYPKTTYPAFSSIYTIHFAGCRRGTYCLRRYAQEPGAFSHWRYRVGLSLGKVRAYTHHLSSTGKVAEGCLAILEDLPIQKITIDQLHNVVTDPSMCLPFLPSCMTLIVCANDRHGFA